MPPNAMAHRTTAHMIQARNNCIDLYGDLWPARRRHLLTYVRAAMTLNTDSPLAAALDIVKQLAELPAPDPVLQMAIIGATVDFLDGKCEMPPPRPDDDGDDE